jgi:N6-L-threonylcarbamoyladenine synthase
MLILGIETSCDETAAAVVQDGRRVLSNVIASQHQLHEEYAGVVPEIASRAHVEMILPVVRQALEEAGVGLGRIDAFAVGNRPGLIGSLLVGVAAAKALAWSLDKPLVGVDHVQAHLYSGTLVMDDGDVATIDSRTHELFPALGLVVSGGHTSLSLLHSWTKIQRLGSTIDDAVGEAFDKAAAILAIPYPGGPNLDRLASQTGADDSAHAFPISRLSPTSLDFSFSGLKTSLLYRVRGVPRKGEVHLDARPLTPDERRDLAASFQKAAVDAVILKLSRALAAAEQVSGTKIKALLTGGGVTANSRLRRELASFAHAKGLTLALPAMDLCMDNAAMIAGLGHQLVSHGLTDGLNLRAAPSSYAKVETS